MRSLGLDETEGGRTKRRSDGGLGRLSFGFSFEQSKAWAGCNGPWAVIFALMDNFAVKMGYLFYWYPTRGSCGISLLSL
jgi:hypothetical protein